MGDGVVVVEKKKMGVFGKLVINKIIGYSILFLPVLITVAIKWKDYFTKTNGVSITIGASLALAMMVIYIVGKIDTLKGFPLESIILIIAWCLNSILNDFVLLYFIWWCSDLVYRIFFQKRVARLEKLYEHKLELDVEEEYVEKRQDSLIDKIRNGSV